MKLNQFCIYAADEFAADKVKASMNLLDKEWIVDTATGIVTCPRLGVYDEVSVGKLRFNYTLGTELEILTYLQGPHWHQLTDEFNNGEPFVSHWGYHLDHEEDFPAVDASLLVQEMKTIKHVNPFLIAAKRTYHYKIYDTRHINGVFMKYIKRVQA